MIKTFRTLSPILLVVIFVLITLSFVVFYNIPQLDGLRGTTVARIEGRAMTLDDFRIAQQSAWLSAFLSSGQDLSSGSGDVLNRLTWQRELMLAEARAMGAAVDDSEVVRFVQALPFLQKEGVYNPELYTRFIANVLLARGLTEQRFEQVVREELTLERWRQALLAPVRVSDDEVTKRLQEFFGELTVQIVRLPKEPLPAESAVTEEMLQEELKQNAGNPAYRTAELRSVHYVLFPLDAATLASKDEKAREKALRSLGERAAEFAANAYDLVEESGADAFARAAQLANMTVTKTALFAQDSAPAGLPASPNLNRAVFALTPAAPISDPIETEAGFVVAQLAQVQESLLRPLAEVRPALMTAVRNRLASQALNTRGAGLHEQFKIALDSGKTFADAAKQLKLKVETLPSFSPLSPPQGSPEAAQIAAASRRLAPQSLGGFLATSPSEGIVFYLDKRSEPKGDFVQRLRPRIFEQLLNERQSQLLSDWLDAAERRKGTEIPAFVRG